MKSIGFRIVLVTCSTLSEARKIARKVVEGRLAACVNISTTPVESIYRWKSKIEASREYLLSIKTIVNQLAELERLVRRVHSYDVPEFVVLPIIAGSQKYLGWLSENVDLTRRSRKK